ncbi:MAG: Plug domain-containing protein [Parvularculaceae bacterium]
MPGRGFCLQARWSQRRPSLRAPSPLRQLPQATIVVTAQKARTEHSDIGLSVSALSGEQMLERNVDNLEGVLGFVPGTGFYDVTGGGVPIIILRGVGLQNFRINDTPTTAIYVDEVYQTSVAEAAATLFDVERVEVIKGPQGGLYGRNAVGGAVQVISRAPSLQRRKATSSRLRPVWPLPGRGRGLVPAFGQSWRSPQRAHRHLGRHLLSQRQRRI